MQTLRFKVSGSKGHLIRKAIASFETFSSLLNFSNLSLKLRLERSEFIFKPSSSITDDLYRCGSDGGLDSDENVVFEGVWMLVTCELYTRAIS